MSESNEREGEGESQLGALSHVGGCVSVRVSPLCIVYTAEKWTSDKS